MPLSKAPVVKTRVNDTEARRLDSASGFRYHF
jgi:hypothetical protein